MAVPQEQAPWGDVFGMLTDRFGTSWMISIDAPKHGAEQEIRTVAPESTTAATP